MRNGIDLPSQRSRKREALRNAVTSTAVRLCLSPLLIRLGWSYREESLVAWVFLTVGIVYVGTIVPIWISYQTRIKEIEGGEEDAAAQY